jgi:hypothetical protein
MRYFREPEANGVVSLRTLVLWLVNNDDRFNRSGPGIRAGLRIEDALKEYEGKGYVGLSDEHYQLLAAAVEEPTAGYPPLAATMPDGRSQPVRTARVWLPFIDAIREAKDTAPIEIVPSERCTGN